MPTSVDALALFRSRLPRKPYCSDDKTASLIRGAEAALKRRYIQHNPPDAVAWLVFDVDRVGAAFAWDDAELPAPAWVAMDRRSRRGHVCYGLTTPVVRTDAARLRPLRYLAAVEAAYGRALAADPGYGRLLTKNPLHAHWHVLVPAANAGVYELGYLAEFVELPGRVRRRRDVPVAGLGRNCALFEELRAWAYRAVRSHWGPERYRDWERAVLQAAEERNVFQPALPYAEVRATARSVARWTWRHITPVGWRAYVERTHTPARQAERGRRSGVRRRAASALTRQRALALAAAGLPKRRIARALGVSEGTVRYWIRTAAGA